MNLQTPAEQVATQYDMWSGQWENAMREKCRKEAERIFDDPISLAFVLSEAIDAEPMKFGSAIQELRKGDAFAFAALATAAVYQSVREDA